MTAAIRTTCDVCGATGVDVRPMVVRWVDPQFGQYEALDRCLDIDACKARVAANGDPWPIEDRREGDRR